MKDEMVDLEPFFTKEEIVANNKDCWQVIVTKKRAEEIALQILKQVSEVATQS